MERKNKHTVVSESLFGKTLSLRQRKHPLPADNSPPGTQNGLHTTNISRFGKHRELRTADKSLSGKHQHVRTTDKSFSGERHELRTAMKTHSGKHQQLRTTNKTHFGKRQQLRTTDETHSGEHRTQPTANNSHTATDNIRHIVTASVSNPLLAFPIETGRVNQSFIYQQLKTKSYESKLEKAVHTFVGCSH